LSPAKLQLKVQSVAEHAAQYLSEKLKMQRAKLQFKFQNVRIRDLLFLKFEL